VMYSAGSYFSYQTYVVPVYYFKCSCNLEHYLPRDNVRITEDNYEIRMFRPKFLKNFISIKNKKSLRECKELIPHVTKNVSTKFCSKCSTGIQTQSESFVAVFRTMTSFLPGRLSGDGQEAILNSLTADNLKYDISLDRFLINYWAFCIYNWTGEEKNDFKPKFESIKNLMATARETNLLTILQENTNRFEKEIASILASVMIAPLINIVCIYAYTSSDRLGKIISSAQKDILKYGAMIAADIDSKI